MLKTILVLCVVLALSTKVAPAQDAKELEAERVPHQKLQGEHPLVALMKTESSSLITSLEGVHPRVFLTQAEIDELKLKTKTQPDLWQIALRHVRALSVEAPPPPAETRRAQNEVGIGVAEAALAYKITGEKKYLDAAKKYMDAACSYDVWGYAFNKPNTDLAAGHLLYGLGWSYDLLYHELTNLERDRYRSKLTKQARLMYEFFKPQSGKTYAYSQNHTFIPIAGLGVAAYALMGEAPDAKDWAALSRAIYDRVLATYSKDGYYYEGVEYWIFSTPWLVHYMDAHRHSTGEDLYQITPGLRNAHRYIAHATLPGGEFNFDYGDIYSGPITRARTGDDYERERIDGHFRTNYNILYHLASRYGSGEAQGVAEWLKAKGQVNAEELWTFIWFDPAIRSVSIERQQKWCYFADHEVVYWRSSWADDATAFSFKAGPPEGHAATDLLKRFPDWRLSSGHAHPDAGSFIIWSRGKYLTGDSGYAGIPLTEHHNTLVFDGKGQAKEGDGHDVFADASYERLNKIRINNLAADTGKLSLTATLTFAYEAELGVKEFTRLFEFTAPGEFTVTDRVTTNRDTIVTAFLHSDKSIVELEKNKFEFEPGQTSLIGEILDPKDNVTRIEKNFLIAPGKPGSVDKGEREERGVRLSISTKEKTKSTKFMVELRIRNR